MRLSQGHRGILLARMLRYITEYHLAVQNVPDCFLVLFPVLLVGATYLFSVHKLSLEESLLNHDCRVVCGFITAMTVSVFLIN